jgi:hypothetical protein
LRPDGQSEQILTFLVYACCNPNIFGKNFEILSVHKTEIFGNFHLASSPIIGGPGEPGHFARECLKSYDVRYMTLDERQDWVEHLLSDADVTAAQTPIPDPELVASPERRTSEAEEDFAPHSG